MNDVQANFAALSIPTPASSEEGSNDSYPITELASTSSSPTHSHSSQPEVHREPAASPPRALAESDTDSPSKSLQPLVADDAALRSPIVTPLPDSPIELDNDDEERLTTPLDGNWSRSRLTISEGEDEPSADEREKSELEYLKKDEENESTSKEKVESTSEEKGQAGEAVEAKAVEEETIKTVPIFTLTKATLGDANETVSGTQPSTPSVRSEDGEATETPFVNKLFSSPSISRINTGVGSSFITDAREFFASPAFTNNAAPNSAITPKTTAFFNTDGIRSPPRPGGAVITEIFSETEREFEKLKLTSTKAQGGEDELSGSNSTGPKTADLISPSHSDEREPEPLRTFFRIGRPSNSPSRPSSRLSSSRVKSERRHHSSSRDRRPPSTSHDRHPSNEPRSPRIEPDDRDANVPRRTFTSSRTFVSTTRSYERPLRAQDVKIEEKAGRDSSSLSLVELVEKVKKALRTDELAYYTLKGVLVEHEEISRARETSKRDEKKEVPTESKNEHFARPKNRSRRSALEEPADMRRKEPVSSPVKKFSLTQTDTESEAETYRIPRRETHLLRRSDEEVEVVQARQGYGRVSPTLRRRNAPPPPQRPTQTSTRRMTRDPVLPSIASRYSPFDTVKADSALRSSPNDVGLASIIRHLVDEPTSFPSLRRAKTLTNDESERLAKALGYTSVEERFVDTEASKVGPLDTEIGREVKESEGRIRGSKLGGESRRRHSIESISPRPRLSYFDDTKASPSSFKLPIQSSSSNPPSGLLVNYLRTPGFSSDEIIKHRSSLTKRDRQSSNDIAIDRKSLKMRKEGEKKKIGSKGKGREEVKEKKLKMKSSSSKGKSRRNVDSKDHEKKKKKATVDKAKERENSISFDFDDFF